MAFDVRGKKDTSIAWDFFFFILFYLFPLVTWLLTNSLFDIL
jgi:hypothetical protein